MDTEKKRLSDGYISASKKIGTVEDIGTHNTLLHQDLTSSNSYLAELYDTNSIVSNVINIPIDEALREGRTILDDTELSDNKSIEKLERFYIDNNIGKELSHCLKMARLYGGCFLYLDDGREPSSELLKGELRKVKTLTREVLTQTEPIELNPLSYDYLVPNMRTVAITGEEIHKSKLIYVDGENCSSERRISLNGFGVSILERLNNDISSLTKSTNRALNILDRLSQDVLKIDGLNESLSRTETEAEIIKRLTAMNMIKNNMSTLAIDALDDYSNVNRSLSGVKDVITEFKELVSSSSRIPYSKLFGTSSTGLNSTGENEVRNYYDEVKAIIQEGKLRPLYNIIDYSYIGRIIDFSFNDLHRQSDLEKSEILKNNSDSALKLLDAGVLEDDEIRKIIGLKSL